MTGEVDLDMRATELRLGLPGTHESVATSKRTSLDESVDHDTAPVPKAQIVGWPPVRSYRKNNTKSESESGIYVKVSMDGAAYLRKIDLRMYGGYSELLKALEAMFKLTIGGHSERDGFRGSEYALAYEDKDGDLMLVGDVPWDMFMSTCKRLRIMKDQKLRAGSFSWDKNRGRR